MAVVLETTFRCYTKCNNPAAPSTHVIYQCVIMPEECVPAIRRAGAIHNAALNNDILYAADNSYYAESSAQTDR